MLNSGPGGPLCLLVFGSFSAPSVHSSHWLAKEWTHLGMQALIDSWLKGNHKNLQTLRPPGNWVWQPCSRLSLSSGASNHVPRRAESTQVFIPTDHHTSWCHWLTRLQPERRELIDKISRSSDWLEWKPAPGPSVAAIGLILAASLRKGSCEND